MIEGLFAFFELLFSAPKLLFLLIIAIAAYLFFVGEERPIRHKHETSTKVIKFIRGGLKAVKDEY